MTLECGIRFLTDYLEGDHYFHIARPVFFFVYVDKLNYLKGFFMNEYILGIKILLK